MSHHARNWLKFVTLAVMAFALGLFFAGLLKFPRSSVAQDRQVLAGGTPIVEVNAPRIPSARPLADLSEAFSAVAEAVRPSVVYISAERPAEAVTSRIQLPEGLEQFFGPPERTPTPGGIDYSSGSGFIVSADGYILTNHHVIEGATHVDVRLLDGRVFEASVVGSDRDTDVGVIKIDATGLAAAALGSSDAVRIGEWVLAIGNPLGANLSFSVTQGIVSAKGRNQVSPDRNMAGIQDFIQTDAAINKGNSGGPLVNVRGEVIGINSAIASATGFYAGYAFAVPIDLARLVMNQIITKGRVERTALGIIVAPATEADALYLGLDSIVGVRIDGFAEADSPSNRAGLAVGDVIVKVDDVPIGYVAQLQQLVGFRSPGDVVKVEVARANGHETVSVRLTSSARPEQEAPAQPAGAEPTDPATQNRIGTAVATLTPEVARQIKLPASTRGVLVTQLGNRSPAFGRLCATESRAGCSLEQPLPDVIVAVEGRQVRNDSEFASALDAAKARNGVISLTVVNGGGTTPKRVVRVRVE